MVRRGDSSTGAGIQHAVEKGNSYPLPEYTGVKGAVSCVNGTNALHLALILVGVDRDSEVISQPLTFIATANAIVYTGARPIFIDVDRDTLCLSPSKLKQWLQTNVELRASNLKGRNSIVEPQSLNIEPYNRLTGKRISACLPMRTFGHPCRIDEIVEICNQYHIPVVEDAAESLGSYYNNRHTGTFGRIGVLSFNGNKVLTTGGGGMLLFNDEALAKRAKHLSTQAKIPHPWEFSHNEIGYNYRMPNINTALGLAQLERLPAFLKSKRQIAEAYKTFFSTFMLSEFEASISTLTFVKEPSNAQSNYWLNCILLNNKEDRDVFLKYSNENGVMTRPAWTLMNKLPMFNNCQTDELTNAKELEEKIVNIPSSIIK
jgi:aminotransferase in exopolysaccharide biosynthesis